MPAWYEEVNASSVGDTGGSDCPTSAPAPNDAGMTTVDSAFATSYLPTSRFAVTVPSADW